MRYMKCFHLKSNLSCRVFKGSSCPEDCSAKITDPERYIKLLEDMRNYNFRNEQACNELRKKIKQVREAYNLPEPEKEKAGPMNEWKQVYNEETRRGERKGNSEGNDKAAGLKTLMKDNRPQECKMTSSEKQELKEETEKWEEKNGKLERLKRGI